MKDKNQIPEDEKSTTRNYFYFAVACAALGVIAFGLAFTVLAIYALICSVLLEILALSFCRIQKKRNDFPALKYLTAVCYALLIAVAAFFIGGIIYSAL